MKNTIVKIDQEVLDGIARPEYFHKYVSNEGVLVEIRKNTYVVRMKFIDTINEREYEDNIPFLKEWCEITPEQIENFRMYSLFEEAKRMYELREKHVGTDKFELYRGRFSGIVKSILLMGWESEWDEYTYENDIDVF